MKLLFVDDSEMDRKRTTELLEQNNFIVDSASSAEAALALAKVYDYTAGIFDLYLTTPPQTPDGIELLRNVRRLRRTVFPILILTMRDDAATEINVLQDGASNYVPKYSDDGLLLTRLNVMIRDWYNRPSHGAGTVLHNGPISLDLLQVTVHVNGAHIHLTPYEFRLLRYLMMNKRVISNHELINQLFSSTSSADQDNIHNLVSRVRKKLDPKSTIHPIRTIPGIGYAMQNLSDDSHRNE